MRPPDREMVESTRLSVELGLSVALLVLAAIWAVEPAFIFGGGTSLDRLWIWAAIFVPGLLSLSLLARCVRYGWEGFRDLIGKPAYPGAASFSLNGIFITLVVGIVASYTLWWSLASLYVIIGLETGGVILGPVFAVILGTVLAAVVLARTALYRILTEEQQEWLQGPMAK